MPGKASLEAGQYYAHPRNGFWAILGEILGAHRDLPYETRLNVLTRNGVALWDVLDACVRHSSLDSDIDADSIVVNDLAGLLSKHRSIRRVLFNGQMACKVFRKFVLPDIDRGAKQIEYLTLPSTSPANASIPQAVKINAWRDALSQRSSVPVLGISGNA